MLSFLHRRYLQAMVAGILNWTGHKDRLAYLDSWEDLGLLHRPLVELLNNFPKFHRKRRGLRNYLEGTYVIYNRQLPCGESSSPQGSSTRIDSPLKSHKKQRGQSAALGTNCLKFC